MNAIHLPKIGDVSTVGGLYTVPRASRLLGASQSKIRSWIDGYGSSQAEPILRRRIQRPTHGLVLTFIELIESAWVSHFVELGYSPQTIRNVAEKLRCRTDFDHPFASKRRFLADGKAIFEESIQEDGEARLLNLMNDNFTMPDVVEQSLFDRIFYVEDVAAQFCPWDQSDRILVDPKIAMGKPHLSGDQVPTEAVYSLYLAEEDIEAVCDDFRLPEEDVLAAVQFETFLAERTLH